MAPPPRYHDGYLLTCDGVCTMGLSSVIVASTKAEALVLPNSKLDVRDDAKGTLIVFFTIQPDPSVFLRGITSLLSSSSHQITYMMNLGHLSPHDFDLCLLVIHGVLL